MSLTVSRPLLRPARRLPTASVVLAGVFAGVAVLCWLAGWQPGVDTSVYRSAALALWHGQPLYDLLAAPPMIPELRFTYPPIAAPLFLPLAALPNQLAWGVLAMASSVSLGVVARLTLVRCPWIAVVGVLAVEPVWRSLGLGQVNLVLLALVMLDVLALRGSRFAGVLVGLAAAIKLTPLIFVAHLAITGRWRDAARALGTFAALHAVGAVLLPADSARFWTEAMLGGNQATRNSWWGNQSLNGLIQRLSGEASWAFAAAAMAALVCLAGCAVLVRALHLRAEPVAAVLVTGFCGVLVSPVSWSHHWVWAVPLVLLLARRGRWLAAALTAAVFTGGSFALVPQDNGVELWWTPLQALLGNAYVLAALAGLLLLAVRLALTRTGTTGSGQADRSGRPRR
ncbi:glycosyltransferase 87 family protein [Solihabitans fulvus]|uniref:glycosyltransferase 87 family protein n=1 Tax=Solihabitans fulvus TaxID=1892852 RepID=UPI001CB75DAB|nr:glycosyltransferase 87 family protein [Solihabitans fulvus]